MGKVDDMRAMREARYAATNKGVKGQHVPLASPEVRAAFAAENEVECGHRAISGKTCTRPKDHSEKNHRYT